MKVNVAPQVFTLNGGPAVLVDDLKALRRITLACMLFEDNFYESGQKAANRITDICSRLNPKKIMEVATEAATKHGLRHVPLQLIVEALKRPNKYPEMKTEIAAILKRPDMMTDLVALYWKGGKKPLPNQLKKAISIAFNRFDEYQLAKYNRDNPVKLRDLAFLCHIKPKDNKQAVLYANLVNKTFYPQNVKQLYNLQGEPGLKTPDTWEVKLSAGEEKSQAFGDLLREGKMGKLAILRNLRNMKDAGIEKSLVSEQLMRNPQAMLPFQYLAAARECPEWEDIVDQAMIKSCALKPILTGKTVVLVDVSGSMDSALSAKSKMNRIDAACGLAILLRECCQEAYFMTFSNNVAVIPNRRGMALRDTIVQSQPHGGTMLGAALNHVNSGFQTYDRVIVITDEQSSDRIPHMKCGNNYILNVGAYLNGVGAEGQWTTISGFSEASVDFILEYEKDINERVA